jgi:hypothetical protein
MSATKNLLTRKGTTMAQLEELLAEIRAYHATSSAFMARLQAAGITNGVLDSFTDVFPTAGWLTRSYHVQCGSLVIINAAATDVTISPGPPGPTAPQAGPGIQVIPASSFLTVPIQHHAWTAWGTATAQLSWQAFTGLQPYGVSTL